uniref:N-acetyltransferase domain-containing protein n=1 Tax=Alexandrium monilatum TaxID=311494 RepID=A0A7S4PZH3_9DINO
MFDFDLDDLWDENIEAELLGPWVYIGKKGLTQYRVSRGKDQKLVFEGPDATGGQLSGTLQPQGPWLQAELLGEEGEAAGIIRLRFAEERQAVLSNFRRLADVPWGKDIVAHRAPPPAASGGAGTDERPAAPREPQAEAEKSPWEPWSHWKDEFRRIEVRAVAKEKELVSRWAIEASKLSLAAFGFNVVAGAGRAIATGDIEVACLAKGGTFIGFAMFGPVENKPAIEVHYLAVKDPFKRCGCGAMLLGYVRERCLAVGASQILATCRRAMTNLHHVRFDVRRQFKRPVLVPAVATTVCRRCSGPRSKRSGAGRRAEARGDARQAASRLEEWQRCSVCQEAFEEDH